MRVFVSSTMAGLADHRVSVKASIERALGWSVWTFEDDAAPRQGPLEQIDVKLRKADIVVAIADENYGSAPAHDRFSIAEWEIWRARRYGKPVHLYCAESIRDPTVV